MTPKIRPALASDQDEIFALVESFATSYRPEKGDFEKSFPALLGDGQARVLVAVDQDRVVGYALGFVHKTFFANGNVAWVEEIMVQEDRRRKNWGRALMDGMEKWAQENGCALLALATRRAGPFYQALGYQESALYMKKEL